MSDQDGFDARLAAHFESEHCHVPADAFVANTMQKLSAARRHKEIMRTSLRAAALAALVAASPWLIAGVARLNAALEFSLTWAMGQFGAWVPGVLVLVVVVVLATRLRNR